MNPLGKDIHEGKIIEYIGKNLIYAKDRCVGRLNRIKTLSVQVEDTSMEEDVRLNSNIDDN